MTDEYGKINPFHLVPAIDDNGFLLTERYSLAVPAYVTLVVDSKVFSPLSLIWLGILAL